MIYTIQACDDVLGNEQLKKIYDKDSIQTDMMNTVEFDCLDIEIDQILDYCFTTPFFASHKVAILKNPIFLTAENTKKDYTEFIDKLMNYIKNENESTILIIYSLYEKLDERKKIVKFLKEKTKFIKVETPNAMQLNDIVKKMLEKRGNTVDYATIDLLIEKVGTNLVDVVSEVEKLALFKPNGNIGKEDVEDFVTCNIDASIFDLSNAILEKNVAKSITLFEDLTKGGLEPIVLVSVLANQFRLALLSKNYQRLQFDSNTIAKKLKVHPYRIKLALKLTFSDKDLKELLVKLADLDYHIKIGKINKYHGMKLLILSI
ncbi:DNA polymerase-3 subunit delta [Bacilli bacterium PM5-3]|nr:DNA polymerase-3 subunit delta [Bacilli bacterium PM5-3]MDH6603491.1 DNA polymerase-3 subunit delta [Bacilli bacterium PM5-9]